MPDMCLGCENTYIHVFGENPAGYLRRKQHYKEFAYVKMPM